MNVGIGTEQLITKKTLLHLGGVWHDCRSSEYLSLSSPVCPSLNSPVDSHVTVPRKCVWMFGYLEDLAVDIQGMFLSVLLHNLPAILLTVREERSCLEYCAAIP